MRAVTNFFTSKRKTKDGDVIEQQAITLTAPIRKSIMDENNRKKYATELLDTYKGFGISYLEAYINSRVSNNNIKKEILRVARCLPLLSFFTNSISRVYSTQPTRRFYLEGKEIMKEEPKPSDDESDLFDPKENKDKYYYDAELYEALNELYNDDINASIKQSERYANLLGTAIYKVVTNEEGKMRMLFLQNDIVQVNPNRNDVSNAEQIAFIREVITTSTNQPIEASVIENWSKDFKDVGDSNIPREEQITENDAAKQYEALFGSKTNGSAFAPFVVFRSSGNATDFWDQKDYDVFRYIQDLNLSITELRYLERYASFGLKYGINVDFPADGVLDVMGVMDIGIKNNSVPGTDTGKNYEVGEFKNEGRIKEVIDSIIFNTKMLFTLYSIPLDALVSTNSIKSAENKQLDNEALFDAINSQRDIWNLNEQHLFRTMSAVNNRDNSYKIPKGIEMIVDFEEKNSSEKLPDDWLVEIQNNVSTYLDWLSAIHPDLDRDELIKLLKSNKSSNDSQKEEPLRASNFAQTNEEGELIVPKIVDNNEAEEEEEEIVIDE